MFKNIVGNEQIIRSMKNAIKNNMVSHAYILSGAEGSGKEMLANAFAKTLLCDRHGDDACDECVSCKTFDGGNNPDVIYVRPQKTKSLSVDDVRDKISADVTIKPYNHEFKIYIIPKADTLTVQAQNALLKTLEEPPAYVVFMLLAENTNAFLETIMSRCVLFKIRPLPIEAVKNYLTVKNICDAEKAAVVAEYSQGSIGAAVNIANSEEFGELRKNVADLLRDISRLSYFDVMNAAAVLEKNKDLTDITDMIYMWYRDVLLYKTTGNADNIVEKDLLADIKREAERISYHAAYKIPDMIMTTKKHIRQNVNYQFSLEMLFINIKGELSE